MNQQITEREYQALLKQYKGTDRRYRLKVLELQRLYKAFTSTAIGLQRFAKVLAEATKQHNPLMILKYLILVHGTIQYNYYSQPHLEQLLDFTLNTVIEAHDKMQEWLVQVVQGYYKYLSKISFHGDIYQRSLSQKFKAEECLVDLFMILNQLNAYSHQSKGVFNCAGRYYFQKLFQTQDFFDILQNQFSNLYLLLRSISTYVIKNPSNFSNQQLQSFLESFTELDTINDSLQDLLRNKHYQKALRFQFLELKQQQQFLLLCLILERQNSVQNILGQ